MKRSIITIATLHILTFNLFCQCNPDAKNLIHNASFEDGNNSKPQNFAQFEYVDVWEQDMATRTDDDNTYYLHSPDWFKDSHGFYNLEENLGNNSFDYIHPHSGQCYMGMGFAELIEQKFFNANKIVENSVYKVSFYVEPLRQGLDYFTNYIFNSVYVRVYLAKEKIHYKYNALDKRCQDVS